MPEFELLCVDLRLTPTLENQAQLDPLKAWWQANVSRDISFGGAPAQEYDSYLKAVKRYCEKYLDPALTRINANRFEEP